MSLPPSPSLTLVTGGVRSGKSRWAEARAVGIGGDDVLYVATAEAGDGEMAERIARHRARRPGRWRTVEMPFELPEFLSGGSRGKAVVLIDCVTLWLSNLMTGGASGREPLAVAALRSRTDDLIRVLPLGDASVIVVTNEVGLGGVAGSPLARRYAEELGRLNLRLAERASELVLMVAGRPLLVPPTARS